MFVSCRLGSYFSFDGNWYSTEQFLEMEITVQKAIHSWAAAALEYHVLDDWACNRCSCSVKEEMRLFLTSLYRGLYCVVKSMSTCSIVI